MKKSRSTSPRITGKSAEDIGRSSDRAISDLWKKVNELSNTINPDVAGKGKLEDKDSMMRFTQEGDQYYLEIRFKDGWARIPAPMDLMNKRS
jgi:hypothetical protein